MAHSVSCGRSRNLLGSCCGSLLARANGWYYGEDADILSYEGLYREVERMMEHHPRLKVTFAHFFFMSGNLDRLQGMLDRYPNMRVDVTPGREMYEDFSMDQNRTRRFFEKNQGRILLGTDNAGLNGELCAQGYVDGKNKLENLHRYFESDDSMEMLGLKLRGVTLSPESKQALFEGSFDQFLAAPEPRTVNRPAAAALCRELAPTAQQAGKYSEAISRLYSQLEAAFTE